MVASLAMAAKIHQILAAERGVTAEFDRQMVLAAQALGAPAGPQSPLSGISRTYKPRVTEGDELPPVSQKVQIHIEHDVMPLIQDAYTRLLDLRATRDEANTHARADVVVRGKVILKDVPTLQLLGLETELGKLRAILSQLPVLDPAEEWGWDVNRNAYATEPSVTAKTDKIPQVQVLYDAVVRDGVGIPAQVRQYDTPKAIGDWTEVKFSGCMPAQRREDILRRLAELQTAVKYAREEANRGDAEQQHCGKALFDFLYSAELPSK